MTNALYYGDNLEVLRDHIPNESVDLVYLDPPFNSNATYNVLFRERTGEESPSQIKAFTDTWEWTLETERTYEQDIIENPSVPAEVKEMIAAFRQFIGRNAMMAYLVMMAPRLVELHRVLQPTGSLYLHCDPTASHFLKILLDAVFGKENFKNEITWVRSLPHNDAHRFGRSRDSILWYGRSNRTIFVPQYRPQKEASVRAHYRQGDDGRFYRLASLLAPGGRGPRYEFKGFERNWRFTQENMAVLEAQGLIHHQPGKVPQRILFLEESKGALVQDHWDDISPINAMAKERLGYPTQKPEALLERIISASSNPGDVVLDPFCGCGTAVATAQKLARQWIGIDITHLAVALMKSRLKTAFNLEPGQEYQVIGEPRDVGSARALWEQDPYQFQFWAVSLLEAQPLSQQKKGADQGIDGMVYFIDGPRRTPHKIVVQVKGGHVSSAQVRDLRGVVDRENAAMGFFITLEEPTRPMREEVASAGFFHSDLWSRDFPRIQVRTVRQMLNGPDFDLPPRQPAYQPARRVRPSEGEQAPLAETG